MLKEAQASAEVCLSGSVEGVFNMSDLTAEVRRAERELSELQAKHDPDPADKLAMQELRRYIDELREIISREREF